jgi:hypothetical protein
MMWRMRARGRWRLDASELLLRSGPTESEMRHERSHFRQVQQVGPDVYSHLNRLQKEQYVYDLINNSPKRWNALTFEQQQQAIWYIEKLGGIR